MFLKCSHVALFWNEFFDWWSQVTSKNIQLADSTILCGTYKPTQTPNTPKLGFAGGKILHLEM